VVFLIAFIHIVIKKKKSIALRSDSSMLADKLKATSWSILHLHWLLCAVYYLLDAIVWAVTVQGPRSLLRRFKSEPCESTPVDRDESSRRRVEREGTHCDAPLLCGRFATVPELVFASADRHASFKALETREPLGMHDPPYGHSGVPVPIFGATTWRTYHDVKSEADAFGRGLKTMGFEPLSLAKSITVTSSPFAKLSGPHCLVIIEENCAEWMVAALGAMSCAIPVATASSSGLADDAIIAIINNTSAPGILCKYDEVHRVSRIANACPSLRSIIYTRAFVPKSYPSLNARLQHHRGEQKVTVNVIEFDEVLKRGRLFRSAGPEEVEASVAASSFEPDLEPATAEHLCMIIHSSGASTGSPKGTMMTHRALLAGVRTLFRSVFLDAQLQIEPQDVYLSITPLSHVMEFLMQASMLASGARVAYVDPRSAFNATRRAIPGDGSLVSDGASGMEEFQPTIVFAPPATWQNFQRKCLKTIGALPPTRKAQTLAALAVETAALRAGRNSTVGSFVLRDVRMRYAGGRVKLCLSGGSALNSDLQCFVRAILGGVPFLQMYGLTETGGCACVQLPRSLYRASSVGPPMIDMEVRLLSCLDSMGAATVLDSAGAPYLASDKLHPSGLDGGEPCLGRGEVCVRGPSAASGYYLSTEEDPLSVFSGDGWIRSGDVGMWTTAGQLKIVDRLKNMVKLHNGEYVAIATMEECFRQSAFVDNRNGGVMVYADSNMSKPVALVQARYMQARHAL